MIGLRHRSHSSLLSSMSSKTHHSIMAAMAAMREAPIQEIGMDDSNRTTSPIVTGSSILAIKYADGVMMIGDTLGSYGSLARFKNLQRLHSVNQYTLIGAGGEYSDFQAILKMLEQLTIEDFGADDGSSLDPSEIHAYMSRVMYGRRSKADPLWNQIIVGGFKEGKSFLGSVDLYGTTFEDNLVATGFGTYMAIPLLRKNWRADLTEEEARKLLTDCMRVLYYRDARTINKFQIGKITADGCSVSEQFSLDTQWSYKLFVNPNQG